MATAPKHPDGDLPRGIDVEGFLAWVKDKPGRYELHAGSVYGMAPERAGHAKVKFAVQAALAKGIGTANVACHMLPDGMTVRIDDETAYEPDALVYCGSEVASHVVEINEPLIVVEVLSPSTRHVDAGAKLAGYFQVGAVQHYLIVDPDRKRMIHHQRQSDGTIITRLLSTGSLRLDPPGIEIDVASLFE